MSGSGQEIEAKFYLLHLDRMMARLQELQARLIQSRVLEINLRFDLPDNSLRSQGRVLRLRRDTEARLTYKGPGSNDGGVLGREEIEFVVDDFDKAQQFLEALGYQQTIYYEKYRTTYVLESNSLLFEDQKHTPSGTRASGFQSCLIMLDELPYGNFIEIEGESAELIQNVAAKLELKWKTAIGTSYTALFENVRRSLQLPFRELSFKNFEGLKITLDDLNVQAADHRLSFK